MKISDLLYKENNNLDLIRIILACLVIIGHAQSLNGLSDLWVDPIGYFFKFTYSGALAVKLFFFISGLLVTNSLIIQKNFVRFVVSRFFRLMPALLFVLVMTVFVFGPILTNNTMIEYFSNIENLNYITHNLLFSTEYSVSGMFNDNLYKDTVNGSLWSLRYEVGCYVGLLAGFLVLQNAKKIYWNLIVIAIIIDASLHSGIIFGWLGNNTEINLLPASFTLGAFCAINADKIEINLRNVIGIFLIFLLFRKTSYVELIFVIAFCSAVLYLSCNTVILKFKPKYDISYGIYLWGFLIQQTIYQLWGHMYVGFHCVIALIISMLLALVTYVFIEEPFIDFGKRAYKVLKERMI